MSSSTVSSLLMAQFGNTQPLLNDISCEPWITNPGASDHMTGSQQLFTFYSPCTSPCSVQIANGSLLSVHGIGTIILGPQLRLTNVLMYLDFLVICSLLASLPLIKDSLLFLLPLIINFKTRFRAK